MIRPDFIGLFENLDDDFAAISRRMGISRSLPTTNKSAHRHYSEYYSDETREIVAHTYRRDIELLGYTFDNSNIESLIRNRPAIDSA